MSIKIVKPPKDENLYTVKCTNHMCGVNLEFHQDDIGEISRDGGTNWQTLATAIACPTCGRIIPNLDLIKLRKPVGYKSLWQRIFG